MQPCADAPGMHALPGENTSLVGEHEAAKHTRNTQATHVMSVFVIKSRVMYFTDDSATAATLS
ncbi:hypothetical protein E2C01_068357 [Portunus trituberculatus]|uniref:Uncharacterized protein n=1 Tax=Portunus trituberculatus TaxID=210409 RepID=A0A5B7HRR6_PORTR|nr:hypothetical protein [Portunus trituberculatus]